VKVENKHSNQMKVRVVISHSFYHRNATVSKVI